MQKTFENYSTLNNAKAALDQINLALEEINQHYSDPFDGILVYDSDWICTSFFESWKAINSQDIEQKQTKITQDIDSIRTLQSKLSLISDLPQSLYKLYLHSFASKIDKLKMFSSALYLEAEKSGYPLDSQTRQKAQAKVYHYQRKIYGAPISENPDEIAGIYHTIVNLFANKGDILNKAEQKVIQNRLDQLQKDYQLPESSPFLYPEKITAKLPETNIDLKMLKEIANSVLEVYQHYYWDHIPEIYDRKIVEEKDGASLNISGIHQEFRIPQNYPLSNTSKVTETIISHEIEQHLLHWINNNRFAGKGFLSNGYDLISEWLAKINEDISAGKINSLADLSAAKEYGGISLLWVFIAEQFPFAQGVEFMEIYYKMQGIQDPIIRKDAASKYLQRKKRFVARDLPGASIKDTLYSRGKNRVIDYLLEASSREESMQRYGDLNILKIGPDLVAELPNIKKELNISEDNIIKPLFLWRVLNQKLGNSKIDGKFIRANLNYENRKILLEILQKIKDPSTPPTADTKQ